MNPRKYIHLATGLLSYTPLLSILQRGTRGTISARYCYSVWMRHLVTASQNGMTDMPKTIAELGPGDSLGIGLAGMLSGADRYYALEAFDHSDSGRNLKVFEELLTLFREREPIPDEEEFPLISPKLKHYAFPDDILSDQHLNRCLEPSRIESIREALRTIGNDNPGNGPVTVKYVVPWHDARVIEEDSVDLLYSQAVLEHVDDLDHTYARMHEWLKPGAFMSHQIDFKCHNTSDRWNGHWVVSDTWWKLVRGNKPYLLNRMPHSIHLNHLEKAGFELASDSPVRRDDGYPRKRIADRFQWLNDEDLITSGAHMLARKR